MPSNPILPFNDCKHCNYSCNACGCIGYNENDWPEVLDCPRSKLSFLCSFIVTRVLSIKYGSYNSSAQWMTRCDCSAFNSELTPFMYSGLGMLYLCIEL
ncbi:hypothetical protein WN943_016082 [Citrus x changshan-huyou]